MDDNEIHACEVWAESGDCAHLSPKSEAQQTLDAALAPLIGWFNETAEWVRRGAPWVLA